MSSLPDRQSAFRPIAAICAALALSSCAYQVTEYERQPDLLWNATATRVTITVQWTDDVDVIAKACGADRVLAGCATVRAVSSTENACTILLQRPKDFNDQVRLEVLGHEAMHCLGAKHGKG